MEEIRPILNKNISIGDRLKFNWIFEKFYEKAILIILGFFGIWKILNLLGIIQF